MNLLDLLERCEVQNTSFFNQGETSMKDFKTNWKQRANQKQTTARDHALYAIFRAIAAKSENKLEIARYFIWKSFSPNHRDGSQHPYRAVEQSLAGTNRYFKYRANNPAMAGALAGQFLGQPIDDYFETDEEYAMFLYILSELSVPYDFDRHYTYIFVRQDISPEYQLVQAAHAAMVAGRNMPKHHCPRKTYFAVCGVPDIYALNKVVKICRDNNFTVDTFYEPDIKGYTASATHPIHWSQRGPLRDYPLLTFGQTAA
jgi:hypothetical protein